MKIKLLSLFAVSLLGFSSLSANAGQVDVSGCQWRVVYSGGPIVSNLQCSGFVPVTKLVNGTTCTLHPAGGYSVTGTCASFSVFTRPVTPPPSSACKNSAYAGKFQGSVRYSQDLPPLLATATANCNKGSCGVTVIQTSTSYDAYCKKE
jgi:hypothetical protein